MTSNKAIIPSAALEQLKQQHVFVVPCFSRLYRLDYACSPVDGKRRPSDVRCHGAGEKDDGRRNLLGPAIVVLRGWHQAR